MRFWKHSPSNLEVMERLESLERRFKTLIADVDEYFQLVRRAENRIKEKRARMEEQQADTADGTPENGLDISALGRSPTPREAAILAIAKRRRMA